MTNYEKIKNMTLLQMNKLLDACGQCSTCPCDKTTCNSSNDCKEAFKKWLESEVKE